MRNMWTKVRNVGVWLIAMSALQAAGEVVNTREARVVTQQQIEAIIKQEAKAHGLDSTLLLAIARTESSLNPRAKGRLGEMGIFQLRPEMHACASFDARKNTRCAIKYLLQLRRQCASYGDAWITCYNYGPNRKLKHPKLFPYYKRVMAARD